MEDLIIVAIVFGSALAALKLILDFVRERRGGSSSAADRSLTTSQLSGMIGEEVERAVLPLRKRIEHLEAIATEQPLLAAHESADRIDLPVEAKEPLEIAPKRRQSKV